METTIGTLEEQLATANDENQQAMLRSETLKFEVEELSEKLNFSNSELQRLEDLVPSLVSYPDFHLHLEYILYLRFYHQFFFFIVLEGRIGRSKTMS